MGAKPKVKWEQDLLDQLADRVSELPQWAKRMAQVVSGDLSMHLAIFVEPFLQYVLDGRKTVESRFAKRPIAPYGRVSRGDVLVLKRSSGPVVALCEVVSVWEYELDKAVVADLRTRFSRALCAMDPGFWAARTDAKYLTLMQIRDVLSIDPLPVQKVDRRGWVVVSSSSGALLRSLR